MFAFFSQRSQAPNSPLQALGLAMYSLSTAAEVGVYLLST